MIVVKNQSIFEFEPNECCEQKEMVSEVSGSRLNCGHCCCFRFEIVDAIGVVVVIVVAWNRAKHVQ